MTDLLCYTSRFKERGERKQNKCLGQEAYMGTRNRKKSCRETWKNNLNVRNDACGGQTVLWLSSSCNLTHTEGVAPHQWLSQAAPSGPPPAPGTLSPPPCPYAQQYCCQGCTLGMLAELKVIKVLIRYSWYIFRIYIFKNKLNKHDIKGF